MRRFVIVGRKATASPDFLLDDLAGTSGRLDVLLRCLRAAILVSHGLRRDVVVYLVMLGGERAPRTLRLEGAAARFIRPDERALAMLVKKALARDADGGGFVRVRDGIFLADGGIDAVLADVGAGTPYILEEGAPDLRTLELDAHSPIVFVGGHTGFDDDTRSKLAAIAATPISIGPVSIHADDAVAIVSNELDRRLATVGRPA